jgi:hypothetical protein
MAKHEQKDAMGVSGGRNLWILAERYRLFGRGRWWVMVKDEKSTYVATFGLYTFRTLPLTQMLLKSQLLLLNFQLLLLNCT